MIDKVSMTSTRIPYMNEQAKSSLATGLAEQPTQTSLRTQLLQQADKVFTPDRVETSFPSRIVNALNSVADAQNEAAKITRDYELERTGLVKSDGQSAGLLIRFSIDTQYSK